MDIRFLYKCCRFHPPSLKIVCNWTWNYTDKQFKNDLSWNSFILSHLCSSIVSYLLLFQCMPCDCASYRHIYVPMCVAKTFNISTSNSLEEQFIILSLFYSFFCLMPMTMFVRRFNVSTNKKKEDITKREGVKLPYNSFVAHYMRSTI